MSERLDEKALSDLEKAYRDRRPTYPCPVCKQTDWTLGAAGMGRETWVCRIAQDARPMDWDHYGASSREVMSGDPDVLALISEVRERRTADIDRTVVVQLINPRYDTRSGLRLVVDGEVVATGDFGGEPEDNTECRDYKWVKDMLAGLARCLGADARIETVEVDGGDDRELRHNYYTAMAAPYRKPEGGQ